MAVYIGTGNVAAPAGDGKGTVSGVVFPTPKTGQIWPRGSKSSAG